MLTVRHVHGRLNTTNWETPRINGQTSLRKATTEKLDRNKALFHKGCGASSPAYVDSEWKPWSVKKKLYIWLPSFLLKYS